MRCSQWDNSVTGCAGALHPIGQPISQSEKFGPKVKSPGQMRVPGFKVTWSGREDG
ncbi:hypothetical protein [Roseibium polysiphoniae]|uniref:hypothetical protein n=1 Tax=Roseibium polysiphoniae TaxID=2571221 RepID=UPI003297EA11